MVGHEKLECSFRREMKQNYLMIAVNEELEHRYEVRMLAGNAIDGLMKFRVRREDDRCWFCYEITSRQPLSRILERKSITAAQIRRLLLGIAQTLARMEDYLLNESMILLDPDFIYVDPDEFQPALCLLPGRTGSFPQEFSGFLQFLLGKTDHQDKEAVVLIYGLYQESMKENYGLDNLLRWLMKGDCPNLEYTAFPAKSEKIEKEQQSCPEEDYADETREDGTWDGRRESAVRAAPSAVVKRYIPVLAFLPVPAAAVLWLWKGTAGLFRYGAFVIGGAAVPALVIAGLYMLRRRAGKAADERFPAAGPDSGTAKRRGEARQKTYLTGQNESWEMTFAADEQENPEDPEDPALLEPQEQPENSSHTTLLWTRAPQMDVRRLVGDEGTRETIPISYYPFLIGKQENLADHILRYDTISRLHARIDRREDAFWLTDLNSTNGTSVNGRLLEANETVELCIGDRVDMADLHFRFQ